MAPVTLPFRLVADIIDAAPVGDDNSAVWLAQWDSDNQGRFEVTMRRTTHRVRDTDADVLGELGACVGLDAVRSELGNCFGLSMGGLGASTELVPVTGLEGSGCFITVTGLPTMANRCHGMHVTADVQDTMGQADFRIIVDYGANGAIQFDTTMAVGETDPRRFDTSDVRSLVRLATQSVDALPADDGRENTPGPEPAAYGDATEVSGDIFARPLSDVGVVSALEPLSACTVEEAEAGHLGDAVFCVDVSPTAKYNALGGMIRGMVPPGGTVFIAGDSPGSLAQALLAEGIDVYGVDPLNQSTTIPGVHGRGQYRMVCGSVHLAGDDTAQVFDLRGNRVPPDIAFDCYVVDTSEDLESAEAATARNLAVGWAYHRKQPGAIVIAQLRSAPLQCGHYGMLDLPGHSNQGCEAYAVLGVRHGARIGRSDRDWQSFCWALASVEEDDDPGTMLDYHSTFSFRLHERHRGDAGAANLFFLPAAQSPARRRSPRSARYAVPVTGIGDLSHWYQFVTTRAFLAAQTFSATRAARVALSAKNPVELLAGLEDSFGGPSHIDGISGIFNPEFAEGLTGVAPGLFNRHPSLRAIVRARYESLARLTTYARATTPPDIAGLFVKPASGVLLRGLSAIRSLDDDWSGPIIADFKRVLPYELMAALSCRPIYKAVYQYAYACLQGLGKPMHAWELQHLLWSLTTHGTMSSRLRYLAARLRGAVFPAHLGRRAPPLGPGRDGMLAAFERNLRVLGIAESYSAADRSYDAARDRVFLQTRSRTLRADIPRDDAGYADTPSTANATPAWRRTARPPVVTSAARYATHELWRNLG